MSNAHEEPSVLIAEDDEGMRELIRLILKRHGYTVRSATTGAEAYACAVENSLALMILDVELPDMHGLTLLDRLAAAEALPPFLVISGHTDTKTVVEIMKRGATDYLVKDEAVLDLLPSVVERAIGNHRTRRRLVETETRLREAEARYRRLLESAADGMLHIVEDRIVFANRRAREMLDYDADSLRALPLRELFPEMDTGPWTLLAGCMKDPSRCDIRGGREARIRTRNGELIAVEFSLSAVSNAPAEGILLRITDITERKRESDQKGVLEQRLRRAEKLEAVGRLAGSIAHDFKNLLGGVMAYADLLKLRLSGREALQRYAEQIRSSCSEASQLIAQLLSFARANPGFDTPVDIHLLVQEVAQLLEHMIDPRITIELDLAAENHIVTGDMVRLKNAVLNLAVNARDAISDSGRIIFRTACRTVDEAYCARYPEAHPGEYLMLTVSDTGSGIPPEELEKVFDPFFTTKEPGKGTGLGLTSVYGCVRAHGGHIVLHSRPQQGTTFTLALPAAGSVAEQKLRQTTDSEAVREALSGTGHILVVDDEPVVLSALKESLQELGYTVVACGNADEALEYYRVCHAEIDLVLLDMVMPLMSGREALRRMRQIDADVPALFITGYSSPMTPNELTQEGVAGMIQKPFDMVGLSHAVHHALANDEADITRPDTTPRAQNPG